jgi:hypothetical protein
MKKWIVCVGALILLLLLPFRTTASDILQTVLFQVKIFINEEETPLDSHYTIMNYKGHAYVPIRFISEKLGAFVGYNEQTSEIYIDPQKAVGGKSEIHAVKTVGDFKLTLRSVKSHYKEGESFRVWSELEYNGKQPVTIAHALYPLAYSIRRAGEEPHNEAMSLPKILSIYESGDEFVRDYPTELGITYNMIAKGTSDLSSYLGQTKRPRALLKGEYIIRVIASFAIEEGVTNGDQNLVSVPNKFHVEIPLIVE